MDPQSTSWMLGYVVSLYSPSKHNPTGDGALFLESCVIAA